MAASQLYLLFPSYTRQIMNGSLNPALIYTVIAVVSGQACITSVSQFILAAASAKVSLRLRELIWRQILRLPVPFFDAQPSKDLISRVTQDTAKLSDLAVSFPRKCAVLPLHVFRFLCAPLFLSLEACCAGSRYDPPSCMLSAYGREKSSFHGMKGFREKSPGLPVICPKSCPICLW